MSALVPIRRALLSASDKAGLVDFARALASMGAELISTGGTASALEAAGLRVTRVEQLTGVPEMLDGRVKTLHPSVHAPILARRDRPEHLRTLESHQLAPIDLVCVNLYPFERAASDASTEREDVIEEIDVGGPTMIRAAAKNHAGVCVVTDPAQYGLVLEDLRAHAGAASAALRARLAFEAFARTASYDAAIAAYLSPRRTDDPLPDLLVPALRRTGSLRYGENPHQQGAAYTPLGAAPFGVLGAQQLHGKALSYNNLNDASAALLLADELADLPGALGERRVAAVIVKHANPCGAAVAPGAAGAVELALKGDPVAAYGGIVAVAGVIDGPAAEVLTRPGQFLEVVLASGFEAEAIELLRARWAQVRVLELPDASAGAGALAHLTLRTVSGGVLVQERDQARAEPDQWALGAGPPVDERDRADAAVVWTIAKHLSSNAIALGGREAGADGVRLFGAGAGQMDRLTSCRLAIEKAGALARGCIAASDAFFPFPDGPGLLLDAGARILVHPGGSKRDRETLDLCAARGASCLLTGRRHFRH